MRAALIILSFLLLSICDLLAADPAPTPAPAAAPPPLPVPDDGRLTLPLAEQIVRSRNREVQAARRAVDVAEAGTLAAAARPNPMVSLNSSYWNLPRSLGGSETRSNVTDTILRVDQPFERGGKRELRREVAKSSLDAAKLDLDDTQRLQLLALRLAYFDLKLAEERLRVAREQAGLLAQTLEKARLRLKAGDIASSDLARIQVDALRAQNEAKAAEIELLRAQTSLARLLVAEPRARELRTADPWPDLAETSLDGLDQLLEGRPDVNAASRRLAAADTARKLAESLQTRDVTVGAQFERDNQLGANYFGVGVAIPLFTGYRFQGEIRKAYSDWGSAIDQLERARALARSEATLALADVQDKSQRVRRYRDELLPAARRAAAAAEFAYTKGAAGVIELLDARRQLRAVELEAVGAYAEYAKARAGLAAALNRDL
jgi:cobalt-zinc-cadmium efflux system outer membrane protein